MKKLAKLFGFLLVPVFILGLLVFQNSGQIFSDSVSDNQTIRILYEKLKDKSEEEVESYFAGFGDEKKIIADHTGGFLTSIDDNYTESERYDFLGRKITQSFDDPKVAATIGEVKEFLRNH